MNAIIESGAIAESDALCEFVDGVVVEKPPKSSFEEVLSNHLLGELMLSTRASRSGRAYGEVLYDFSVQIGRKLRPDVSFVSEERWPIRKPAPRSEGWSVIPNLAVEVISDGYKLRALLLKVQQYFKVGVEQVWIIEPVAEWIQIYSSEKSITVLNREDVLTYDRIPGFRLPLEQLFHWDE